jgi:hypothetical protein
MANSTRNSDGSIAKPGGEYAYDPSVTNKYLNTHRASGMPSIGADTGSMPITSTNVSVWCNGSRVGVIKSMSVNENRTNVKLQELGTEGVVQIVPGNTNGGTLSINRFALYNSSLFNALGLTREGEFQPYGDSGWDEFTNGDPEYHNPIKSSFSSPFKTLKDQRVPIEIQTKTQMHGDQWAFYIETYVDCWLNSYGKTISANDITITENASIDYSDVIATYKKNDRQLGSNS